MYIHIDPTIPTDAGLRGRFRDYRFVSELHPGHRLGVKLYIAATATAAAAAGIFGTSPVCEAYCVFRMPTAVSMSSLSTCIQIIYFETYLSNGLRTAKFHKMKVQKIGIPFSPEPSQTFEI